MAHESVVRPLLRRDQAILLASLVPSILIGEFFYKFRSFTLEVLAFLATWWLLHQGLSLIAERKTP